MRWYVSRNGETTGPMDGEKLAEWGRDGLIVPGMYVRDEAGSNWMPVEQSPFAGLIMGAPGRGPLTPERSKEIGRTISRLNTYSLLLGGPGLLLQVIGNSIGGPGGLLVMGLGTLLLIWGLTYYARMRGQSAWWGLLGLLSCLGMVLLLLLPKECHNCGQRAKGSTCGNCGAPAPK